MINKLLIESRNPKNNYNIFLDNEIILDSIKIEKINTFQILSRCIKLEIESTFKINFLRKDGKYISSEIIKKGESNEIKWLIEEPINYSSFHLLKSNSSHVSVHSEMRAFYLKSKNNNISEILGISFKLKEDNSIIILFKDKFKCIFGVSIEVMTEIQKYDHSFFEEEII